MGARPTEEARRFRDLATQAIDRDVFLELFDGRLKKGANSSFWIKPSGVVASFVKADDRELLFDAEVEAIDDWSEEAKLDFPCSADELVGWVIQAREDFSLPKDFLEAVIASATTRDGREMATTLLKTLREEEVLAEQEAAMEQLEYDGVRGLPLFWDWLPADTQKEFRKYRDRLLSWGITPEQAVSYVRMTEVDGVTAFPSLTRKGEPVNVSLSEEAVSFLTELWSCRNLPSDEALKQLGFEDAAQGHAMREGSKKPRKDALRKLMEKTYDGLCAGAGKPTWRDVLKALQDYDDADDFKGIVQEVNEEEERIYWQDRRGKEQDTSFGSFRERLSKIRKLRP